MLIENRPKFALVLILAVALGSGITYGLDHLNSPKPIIIADAVNIPPQPPAVSPPVGSLTSPSAASGGHSGKSRSKHSGAIESEHWTKVAKITTGVIHINKATLEDLERLPGVGPGTAKQIVDFRTQANGFQSVDELGDVPHMGAKKLKRLMTFVAL